ncbi:MAG: pilus assembly protein TadG-related protein [Alphaproteobacteria bacterium]
MPTSPIGHSRKTDAFMQNSLRHDDTGTLFAPLAIMLPILLGIAGLGIDIGNWYNSKRAAQAAADAAARAGALELMRDSGEAAILLAAKDDAAANGFDDGDRVTISHPPTMGAYAGDDMAVEAVVEARPLSFFSRVLFNVETTVEARAVARLKTDDTCVWALEETDTGFSIVGTADVELGCGIQVNSSNAIALDQNGSSCVTALSIHVVGGAAGSCLNPTPKTGAAPSPDPLAGRDPPAYGGCDVDKQLKINKDETLSPGVYCGGISISGNAEVTFLPGLYVLKGGTFKVSGSSSLEGEEVGFYLTDNAALDITATEISFSAPTSGDMEKILFFQDRNDSTAIVNKIAGNAELELDGALYFAPSRLDLRGTSSTTAPTPIIVARELRFVGTTSLGDGDSPPAALTMTAHLVE